jgi:hypothetical protein
VRAFAIVATTAAVTAATACGGDSPAGPGGPPAQTSPVGGYAIATVNAKPLPFAMFSDTNYLYEVTSGTMSLTADGKYASVMSFRQTIPGNVSLFVDTTSGTWVLSGSTISFTDAADSSVDSASWASGKLTFTESNGVATNVFVYSLSK